MVRKIRNSLKKGKSEAEIVRTLQGRGYKMEYIHLLLKKAKVRKVLFLFLLGSLFLFFAFLIFVGVIVYGVFFVNSGEKMDLVNPLSGLNIDFGEKNLSGSNGFDESFGDKIYIEDIEITAEFISFLLNELGVWQLRSNPITGENPSLNFVIGEKKFSSVIDDGEIMTSEGAGLNPDVIFYSNKNDIVRAMLSESSDEVFKKSYSDGGSSLEVKKSEAELFMKGYLGLYDSLKS